MQQKKVIKIKKILHKNRLLILQELLKGESCVCELKKTLNMPHNLLSHHLKVLKEQGILIDHKNGLHIKYKILKKEKPLLVKLFKCLA